MNSVAFVLLIMLFALVQIKAIYEIGTYNYDKFGNGCFNGNTGFGACNT